MASEFQEHHVSKDAYFKVVADYKNSFKHITQKDLMSKRWVDIMMQRIENARNIIKLQGSYASLHATVKETLRNYDISVINQKDMLVFKPDPDDDSQRKIIIPLEDTFEVVEDAHLRTNHGTQEEMEKWIQNNNYFMHSMCIPAFLKLCRKCNIRTMSVIEVKQPQYNTATPRTSEISKSKLDAYEHVITVDVLDLSTKSDHYYNFLLIYEDRKTGLIQLRPINSNAEADISIELIKILMDFGPPQCMAVDADNEQLYNRVLNRITSLCGRKIALAHFDTIENDKLTRKVTNNIIRWMEEEGCQNWGTGCYVVQWNMNNTPDEHGMTPFTRVFGSDPTKSMANPVTQTANQDSEKNIYQKSPIETMTEKSSSSINTKLQCPSPPKKDKVSINSNNGNVVTLTNYKKPGESKSELQIESDLNLVDEMKYEIEDED